jgi:hypothetical protein
VQVFFTALSLEILVQGWIQDFKLGGVHLKKLRRAEGGGKMFGVFRMGGGHQVRPPLDPPLYSCNNVAPVTNLCLGRPTTRSHSSQWSKKKSCS